MMRDPKKVEGGRALLFERLVGPGRHGAEEGERARPVRVHEMDALRDSVRRELSRLLNTRSTAPLDAFAGGEMSVLDYGVPDFSPLSALSGDDRARLSSAVARSIEAFEPRLRGVRVTAEGLRSNDRALILRLDALLVVGEHSEPVRFHLPVPAGPGEVKVSDVEGE